MEARSPKEQMRIVEAISQIKISAIGFSCKFVYVKSNHFHSDLDLIHFVEQHSDI